MFAFLFLGKGDTLLNLIIGGLPNLFAQIIALMFFDFENSFGY